MNDAKVTPPAMNEQPAMVHAVYLCIFVIAMNGMTTLLWWKYDVS